MAEELVSSYVDRTAVKSDTDFIIGEAIRGYEGVKQAQLQLAQATSINGIDEATKLAIDSSDKYAASLQRLAKEQLNASRARLQQIKEQNALIQQETLVVKQIEAEAAAEAKLATAREKTNSIQRKQQPVDDPTNADIPFTHNLDAIAADYERTLNASGVAVNEFQLKELEAQLSATEWNETMFEQAALLGTLEVATNGQSAAVEENVIVTAADAKIQADLSNEFKQLTLAYQDASIKAKNYALSLGESHPLTIEAANDAKALKQVINDTNATVGQGKQSASSFGEAIGNAFSRVTSSGNIANRIVSGLSRQIISLGVGFASFAIGAKALEFLGDQLVLLYEYVTRDTLAMQKLKAVFADYNAVNEASHKQAGEQIADLKILTTTAQNNTLSTKERTDAVKALKTEFPDYFDQLTQEKILNGDITDTYNELTKAIEKSAIARAAKGKLDEVESQKLDIEFQREKIRNANINEKASVRGNIVQAGGTRSDNGRVSLFTNTQTPDLTSGIVTPAQQKAQSDARAKDANDRLNDQESILNTRESFLLKYAGLDEVVETKTKGRSEGNEKLKKRFDLEDELRKIALQKSIDFNQSVEKDESESFDRRLEALKASYQERAELLRIARNEQLKLNNEDQNDISAKLAKDKPGSITQQNDLIDLQNDRDKAIVIEAKYQADRVKLARESTEAAEKFQEAANERLRNANAEILKTQLTENSKAQQEIFNDENKDFSTRLQAIAQFHINQSELIINAANRDIATGHKTADEIKAIKTKEAADLLELNQQIVKDTNTAFVSSANVEEENAKRDAANGLAQKRLTLYNGLRNKKDFGNADTKLQDQSAQQDLTFDVNKNQKIVDAGADTTDDEKIKATQALEADATAQFNLDLKTKQDNEKIAHDEKIKRLEEEKDLSIDAIDIVQSALDKQFDDRKQQLDDEAELIQRNKQIAIDNVNASSLNAQQRRIETARIEQQAAKEKEAIDQKEKQNAHDKAVFDRDAGILKVIVNTAVGISEAFPDVPLEVETAAAGAVQLAAVLGTKIPSYALGAGVNGQPMHMGGVARFGEAGWEQVSMPGYDPFIATKETIGYLPPFTQIKPIPESDHHKFLNNSIGKMNIPANPMKDESYAAGIIVSGVNQGLKAVENAVRSIPQPKKSRETDFKFIEYLAKAAKT